MRSDDDDDADVDVGEDYDIIITNIIILTGRLYDVIYLKKPTASDAFKTLLKIYRFNGFQNTIAANTAMFKMSIIAPALNSRVSIQADVKWIASSCGSSRCPLPALLFRYVSIKKT